MKNQTIIKEEYSESFQNLLDSADFTSWKWQQRNVINSVDKLVEAFPFLSESTITNICDATKTLKLGLTPYYASLINFEEGLENDPLWKQVIPKPNSNTDSGYDSSTENWEMEHEMVNPIAQRKYRNRVIVRLSNVCHSYCQFCYEALRTLEKKSNKDKFQSSFWKDTLNFIENENEIEEIILSGGEPLMLSNKMIEGVLKDIRLVRKDIVIRIHTRSLTFNPYRIDRELVDIFKENDVKYIGIHITHPNEATDVFFEKAKMLQESSILFANIPLLKGINDDALLFKDFCMTLYNKGILPHYLYHFMPFSPGSSEFKTPISTGINILKQMKRHVSNLAVPEFVLPHHTGKHTVPIVYEKDETPEFELNKVDDSAKSIHYVNWLNEDVNYPV